MSTNIISNNGLLSTFHEKYEYVQPMRTTDSSNLDFAWMAKHVVFWMYEQQSIETGQIMISSNTLPSIHCVVRVSDGASIVITGPTTGVVCVRALILSKSRKA